MRFHCSMEREKTQRNNYSEISCSRVAKADIFLGKRETDFTPRIGRLFFLIAYIWIATNYCHFLFCLRHVYLLLINSVIHHWVWLTDRIGHWKYAYDEPFICYCMEQIFFFMQIKHRYPLCAVTTSKTWSLLLFWLLLLSLSASSALRSIIIIIVSNAMT